MQMDKIGVRHGDKLPPAMALAQGGDVPRRDFNPTNANPVSAASRFPRIASYVVSV
jgi:hypothetical protein